MVSVARAGPGRATKVKALLAPDFVVAVGDGYFCFGLHVVLRFYILLHVKPPPRNLNLCIFSPKNRRFPVFYFWGQITHYVVLTACHVLSLGMEVENCPESNKRERAAC